MADEYLTIALPGQDIFKEKMSKFLAFALHVDNVQQAKAEIARIANEYHDARHVCWAYMLGADRTVFLSSDNGEPSGTAGKPILGQINSHNITDSLVVVVRYFGGIKLGTSGLIAAYREAARLAIENAQIELRYRMETFLVSFPYLAMNDVMRAIKNSTAKISGQEFNNFCTITLQVRAAHAEALKTALNDAGARVEQE